MTGCKVQVKGTYHEFGKKPLAGQRKLYLYVEGNSKQEVANSYKEIKKFLEESSMSNQQNQFTGGFSG